MSEYEARKRVDTQNPQRDKLAKASVVITNNGTAEDVWVQVQREWNKILEQRHVVQRSDDVRRVEVGRQQPAAATPPAPAAAPAPTTSTQTAPAAQPTPVAQPTAQPAAA